MVGAIFVLVILGVTVLVTFWLGIMSIIVGVFGGLAEESGLAVLGGFMGWALLWGGAAWALYGFISTLVGLFQ